MQGLTTETIDRTKAIMENKRQALFDKYRAKFPDEYISDLFLLDAGRAERAEKVCEGCGGYPCRKSTNKGFRHLVKAEDGILSVKYMFCPHAIIARNKVAANIPPMYADKTFADYDIDAGNASVVKAAKSLPNLYIYGVPGCGKTFLASIMANEFLAQGKSVVFVDTPSLLDKMKSTFGKESEASTDYLMSKLARVDVLVLDDLGTENPTQWAVERLYLVINTRYNAQKALIVTSNYDLEQLANRLNNPTNGEGGVTGSRIASRITGLCKIANIKGKDKRRI